MSTPTPELDQRYSEPDAEATRWEDALEVLRAAELSWVSTIRPDGSVHVTPLLTVVHDGLLHFCTGPEERKARNLAANPAVTLTTGTNTMERGLDVVVEGRAERVTGEDAIRALTEDWVAKYGEDWRFEVSEEAFVHPGGNGRAYVFAVRPVRAYGFAKAPFGHTRWRFDD